MKNEKVVAHIYEKWIVQEADALYYTQCPEAVNDFKKLFKAFGYKPEKKVAEQ